MRLAFLCFLTMLAGCSDNKQMPITQNNVQIPITENDEEMSVTRETVQLLTQFPTAFELQLELSLNEQLLSFEICFIDSLAIELDSISQQPIAIFDLDRMEWTECSSGQLFTQAACEDWALSSTERTNATLARAPDNDVKRFVMASLKPEFEVSETADEIKISNQFLNYVFQSSLDVDEQQMDRFFKYDFLNAYRKALIEKKLPPIPQLAVSGELKKRGFVPGIMNLTVNTPNGVVSLTARTKVATLSEEKIEQLRDLTTQTQ